MKKLLLTSAGFENPKVGQEFLKLVNKPAEEIKIIFIPTASRTKEELFYVGKSKEELTSLGVKDIKVLDLDHEVSYGEVKDFDVIYICGGNTFYLLHKVRESGFADIVKQFLDEGKVYVGVSAGSYITCPNIEMANWKHPDRNDVGLTDLTALNLVPFLVTVHYEPDLKEDVKKGIDSTEYPVKILTDEQALSVINSEVKFIGEEEIKL